MFGIIAPSGGVAEWSNAAVLKTVVGKLTGGSNPSSSATLLWSIPETWFTDYTGDMVYTLSGANGF